MGKLSGFRCHATLVLVLLLAGSAWAEVCKGSKVPKADPSGVKDSLTVQWNAR